MTATKAQIASVTPETKEILHQSILHYLHRNGFTKTFKRFQSESHIQNDTWKASTAHLEDIYYKYVNARCQDKDIVVVETETKAKKKKKNKLESASGDENKVTNTDSPKKPVSDTTNGSEVKELGKKTKEKKKKSNEQEICTKENDDINPDVVNEEKKSSKKRKRLVSDESEHQSAKIETNQTVDESDAHLTSDKLNEKSEIDGEKTEANKSGKKQRIDSAEPKTVNAFQRVKIDQVEFAHEKLQDNSYWAKDGADVGYGAKAQEVLGQVRGRDFRHEKTKKKRGSYRGGQIDLQSHSIKFDYSDEE